MIQAPTKFETGLYHTAYGQVKLAVVTAYNINEQTGEQRVNLAVYPDGKHTQSMSYQNFVRIGVKDGERFEAFKAEPIGKEPKDGDGNAERVIAEGPAIRGVVGSGAGGKGRGPVRGGNGGGAGN
jgi:hypothetical protein